MLYLIIGGIVGIVMGLTGSGGALISIPLFMQFLGMPLKEASVLSLFVVTIGAFSNFINFRLHTRYKIGVFLITSSAVGSYLTVPFKKILPDQMIGVLLSSVSFFALYNVWKPSKAEKKESKGPHLTFTISIGLILGLLTTFTGIGGGVLIIPVLLAFYGFNQNEALATSLLTVGLSSLVSFFIQNFPQRVIEFNFELTYLVLGTLISSYALKWVSKNWSSSVLSATRKITFTLVVLVALIKIYFF